MTEYELGALMRGFADGILASTIVGASESCVEQYHSCLIGKTPAQLGAVFAKWLKEHPERWDQQCNMLSYVALDEMCRKLGFAK